MKFLIIIPHFGSDEHLKRLLPSIGITLTDAELSDAVLNTSVVLPFKGGEAYIWNNNIRNIGFTKACNEGIRYGMNEGFDVMWLLNNDTEIIDFKKALDDIEAEFVKSPKTGVIGFQIRTFDDDDFIHHGGTGQAFPAGVHKVGRVSLGNLQERTEEHWVTGASMAISSGCILEIGMLDEKMVNYGSDSDYCFRARYNGFRVVYLPIPILHKVGQSGNPSPEQVKVIKTDMLVFQNKWMTGKAYYDLDKEMLTG
jgi:hypothetical protein